jgi:hypothetical protein
MSPVTDAVLEISSYKSIGALEKIRNGLFAVSSPEFRAKS